MFPLKHFLRFKKRGFTLVELLVTFSIISVLLTIILSQLNIARIKSRDNERLTMLRRTQLALENYYDTYRHYPDSNGQVTCFDCQASLFRDAVIVNPSSTNIKTALQPFLTTPPTDPLPAQTWIGFLYLGKVGGTSYQLSAFGTPENMLNYPPNMTQVWKCPTIGTDGQCTRTAQQITQGYPPPLNNIFIGVGDCKDGNCF